MEEKLKTIKKNDSSTMRQKTFSYHEHFVLEKRCFGKEDFVLIAATTICINIWYQEEHLSELREMHRKLIKKWDEACKGFCCFDLHQLA